MNDSDDHVFVTNNNIFHRLYQYYRWYSRITHRQHVILRQNCRMTAGIQGLLQPTYSANINVNKHTSMLDL